jgi:2-isopropylmalate synthase
VPYLPIDPADIGCTYEAIIRINSQSGKGGIAYVMEQDYGLELPRRLQIEFSQAIQELADTSGKEIMPGDIWTTFEREYLNAETPVAFLDHTTLPERGGRDRRRITASIKHNGKERAIEGVGNGPIDAFFDALREHCGIDIQLVDYREHAVKAKGADATAVAYVEVKVDDARTTFGVGRDENIVTASLKAVASAANRAHRLRQRKAA